MTRLLAWLLLLCMLGVFGLVAADALRTRARAGKDMPAFSVYSRKADEGLAKTADFLRQLELEPVAVTRPIQHTRLRGLLLVVEPHRPAALDFAGVDEFAANVKGLLRWVEQGNTLVYAGRHGSALHQELGLFLATDKRVNEEEIQRLEVSEAGGYTRGMNYVAAEARHALLGGGLPLWGTAGGPGAVLQRRGKGRIFMLTDPSLLTVERLAREDNVMFLVNVARLHARDGKVYFDEYHHGLRSGGGFWGYLRYHDRHGLVLQVLLVAAIALWTAAIRLGPAVPRRGGREMDAVEYASALARIYERAGVRRLLAQTLARDFLASLTRSLRLRRSAASAEILAAWRTKRPERSVEELQELLEGITLFREGGGLTDRQLWQWSLTLERWKREVLGGR